jgi:hypothetical protein
MKEMIDCLIIGEEMLVSAFFRPNCSPRTVRYDAAAILPAYATLQLPAQETAPGLLQRYVGMRDDSGPPHLPAEFGSTTIVHICVRLPFSPGWSIIFPAAPGPRLGCFPPSARLDENGIPRSIDIKSNNQNHAMSTRQWSGPLRHTVAETHDDVIPNTILPSHSPKGNFSSKSSIASEVAPVGQYCWPTGNLPREPVMGNPVPRRTAISPSVLAALMRMTTSSLPTEYGGGIIETHSGSDTSSTATSRSPSPWQRSAGTNPGEACLPEADCDAGDTPNNTANHASYAVSAVTLGTPTNPAHSVPTGRGFQDDDNEPSDEDAPGPKRPRKAPVSSPKTSSRPRFACPYQKYDPTGCRFCCSPNARNPEGGAETISRLRDHMFRNHDPSVRCGRCWLKKFGTSEWTPRYCDGEHACVERAPPTTYWMTEDQTRQLRGIRLVGSGEENWYHLFRLVLPMVPENGPAGWSSFSPCEFASSVIRCSNTAVCSRRGPRKSHRTSADPTQTTTPPQSPSIPQLLSWSLLLPWQSSSTFP